MEISISENILIGAGLLLVIIMGLFVYLFFGEKKLNGKD